MVLYYYAGGRSFNSFNNWNNWIQKNTSNRYYEMYTLKYIIGGLIKIHEKKIVHCDFHIGNILFRGGNNNNSHFSYISDMGLCGEIDNIDSTKIYGVMPYVAPEVLR